MISVLQSKLDTLKGKRETYLDIIDKESDKVKGYQDQISSEEKVLDVLYAVAEFRKSAIKEKVEKLVTKGIQAIWSDRDIKFKLEIGVYRGDVAVKPYIIRKFGDEEYKVNPVEGDGGGIADVVSFILRVIAISLIDPPLSKVVFLDEPFKHVSDEYLEATCELVNYLKDITGLQFVIVTHKKDLSDCADILYRTSKNKKGYTEYDKHE